MTETDNSLKPILLESETSRRANQSTTADLLWTVDDVAGYLKLQPETVRGMARRGDLPGIKIGKVWRFRKSAINKMFQEQA